MLMCPKHWRAVPKALADEIWRAYTPGQEHDLSMLSPEYLAAMHAAIEAVRLRGSVDAASPEWPARPVRPREA